MKPCVLSLTHMSKRFGRHRTLYQDLQSKEKDHKARTLPCDNRLRDIANASFEEGRLTIKCWPSTEINGRMWGLYREDNAVILHFRIRASYCSPLKLNEFDLTMTFGLSEEDFASESNRLPKDDKQSECDGYPIAPIDIPAPDQVESGKKERRNDDWQSVWIFRGDDLGTSSPGAKWSWKADTEDMKERPMLHAGLALLHPNKPFLIRCNVEGGASEFRKRFKFQNDSEAPTYLKLVPEESDAQLEHLVSGLNDQIKAKILGTGRVEKDPGHAQTEALIFAKPAAPQKTYGSSSISGPATVHLGDTFNVYGGSTQLTATNHDTDSKFRSSKLAEIDQLPDFASYMTQALDLDFLDNELWDFNNEQSEKDPIPIAERSLGGTKRAMDEHEVIDEFSSSKRQKELTSDSTS